MRQTEMPAESLSGGSESHKGVYFAAVMIRIYAPAYIPL